MDKSYLSGIVNKSVNELYKMHFAVVTSPRFLLFSHFLSCSFCLSFPLLQLISPFPYIGFYS